MSATTDPALRYSSDDQPTEIEYREVLDQLDHLIDTLDTAGDLYYFCGRNAGFRTGTGEMMKLISDAATLFEKMLPGGPVTVEVYDQQDRLIIKFWDHDRPVDPDRHEMHPVSKSVYNTYQDAGKQAALEAHTA